MCGLFYNPFPGFIYDSMVKWRSIVVTGYEHLLMIANTVPVLYIVNSNFLILQENFLVIQTSAMALYELTCRI